MYVDLNYEPSVLLLCVLSQPCCARPGFQTNKRNPGAFIPVDEWKKLTPEQREAERAARKAKGIPVRDGNRNGSRNVSSVSTVSRNDSDSSDDDDGDRKPPARTSRVSTVHQVPPELLIAPPIAGEAPSAAPATSQRSILCGETKRPPTDKRRVSIASTVQVATVARKRKRGEDSDDE